MVAVSSCAAKDWEVGATFGHGIYRNGTVFSPGGTATAGIRNRFVAGAVIGEDLYEYVSGELRYLYQDGDPFLSAGGVQTNIQGQSHAVHYDVLIHVRPRESWVRPYLAAGFGAKWFLVTGPVPPNQPLEEVAVLSGEDQVRPLITLGGGVKFDLRAGIRVRVDFRDYLTPFPKRLIRPAPGATARGILQQFTPSVGLSYTF
jgi:hypothetical protein